MGATAALSVKKKSNAILRAGRSKIETRCAGGLLKYNHHIITTPRSGRDGEPTTTPPSSREDVNVCVIPGCALLGADPESSTVHCSGFRVRASKSAVADLDNDNAELG
jgi:hypothetical protein